MFISRLKAQAPEFKKHACMAMASLVKSNCKPFQHRTERSSEGHHQCRRGALLLFPLPLAIFSALSAKVPARTWLGYLYPGSP